MEGPALSLFRLDGKVAVVTGASRGLGRAMAVALAQAGADVVGVATGDMAQTADAVAATGAGFQAIAADLAQAAAIEPLLAQAAAWRGHVDILVNNAGITRRNESLDFSETDWDTVLNVDLRAVFFLAQAAARRFVAQGGGGKIVNTASVLSFQGGIRVPAYAAAKHALVGVTRALANEWAARGINVNAIAPGYMATDMTGPLRDDPKREAEIFGRIPAGRWGRPEDLAGAVVFLASAASDYVHGHTLVVDGGWLAR